jgi:hypothetical protein
MTYSREPTAHLHLRLSQALKRAAVREASERGISVRSVFEAALRDRYDPDRDARDKQLVIRELKTMRREITHVAAGNKVLFEALALLVKNLFSSLTPPSAEGRLAGDAFYTRFIDAVVHAIESNEPLMDQVLSLAIINHDSQSEQPTSEVKSDA